MMYLYRLLFLFPPLLIVGCSGGSDGASSAGGTGATNATAIETCFDVEIINSGNRDTKNICTTKKNGDYNGLGVNRFIRFTVNSFSTVSVRATRTSGLNPADPDLTIYSAGARLNFAESISPNVESMVTNLGAGDYVVVLNEFTYSVGAGKPQAFTNNTVQQKNTGGVQLQSSGVSCPDTALSTVSGIATFQRVPATVNGLNYEGTVSLPIQEAVVEVICNGHVFRSGLTDATGNYSLSYPDSQGSYIRVKAQMLTGTMNFSVVDNTTPGQPIYAMDDNANPLITTGNETRNLLASSGWGGFNYISPGSRVAAPFAILDTVRQARDVVDNIANVVYPALKINWSPNNTLSSLGTSFYDSNPNSPTYQQVFLLGGENSDTEEYDEHVIAHEWAHYFEDRFSRSDSIGGPHSGGDIIDIRVAFGEGFGNAFSAMATDDPTYVDTSGFGQSRAFDFNMESNVCPNAGWFSECSVQSILYDIYDPVNAADGGDSLSLGFLPIYNVFVNEQENTPALTSVFSFIDAFKSNNSAGVASAVDTLTGNQNINPVIDIYGSSQTANPGVTDQLPIYELF